MMALSLILSESLFLDHKEIYCIWIKNMYCVWDIFRSGVLGDSRDIRDGQ